jgi:hypothetical protein
VKLSHRDFRPAKRSKYVAAPPRKRPTLRILLLGVFAVIVYLKFDAFVKSKAIQSLRQPAKVWETVLQRVHPMPPKAVVAHLTLTDSSALTLDCASPATEACLSEWQSPEATKGWARALILKAAMAAGMENPEGFSLRLRKDAEPDPGMDGPGWSLISLELRSGAAAATLEPGPVPGEYCWRGGKCLEAIKPMPPLRNFQVVAHGDSRELWLRPAGPSPVVSMLPARILKVTGDSVDARVTLYHGMNILSYYAGFTGRAGLAAGGLLRAGDTLGFAAASATDPFRLRVEKDGMALDPSAFLGLAMESGN